MSKSRHNLPSGEMKETGIEQPEQQPPAVHATEEQGSDVQELTKEQMNKMTQELRLQQDQMAGLTRDLSELQERLRVSEDERMSLVTLVQTIREDFEQERTDRLRAQSRLNDREAELMIIKRQLHQHELSQMNSYAERRKAALDFHREEYERTHPYGPPPQLHRAVDDEEGEDEIDGYMPVMATYPSIKKTVAS